MLTPKVAILGGTGFLGAHIGKRLSGDGFRVVSVGRRNSVPTSRHLSVDLYEPNSLGALPTDVDIYIHLVTDVVPSSAERLGYTAFERNLELSFRIADHCVRTNVRKLIFASSGGAIYGQDVIGAREDGPCAPIGLYGAQKLAVESLLRSRLRDSSCKLINLRIGNPYGAGQERQTAHGVVGHMLSALISGSPFTMWGNGSQVRDYVHVQDVVSAVIRSMSYSGCEDVFNIGSGVGTSTQEVLRVCEDVTQKSMAVTYSEHPSYDVDRVSLNIERARSSLDWEPLISLRDGISDYHRKLIGAAL